MVREATTRSVTAAGAACCLFLLCLSLLAAPADAAADRPLDPFPDPTLPPGCSQEPWLSVQRTTHEMLSCLLSPHCTTRPLPPLSAVLSNVYTPVLDADISGWKGYIQQCPLAAVALAVAWLFEEMYTYNNDAFGTIGLLNSLMYNALLEGDRVFRTFAGAWPLTSLQNLVRGETHRIKKLLDRTHSNHQLRLQDMLLLGTRNVTLDGPDLPRPLCILLRHDNTEGPALAVLRHTVESMSIAGLLKTRPGVELVVALEECTDSSDDYVGLRWYLKWLKARLPTTWTCGLPPTASSCSIGTVVLHMGSRWAVTPLAPAVVQQRLRSAVELLQSKPNLKAVSLAEKEHQGHGGLFAAGRRFLQKLVGRNFEPRPEVLAMLALASAAQSGSQWDLLKMYRELDTFSKMHAQADVTSTDVSLEAYLKFEATLQEQVSLCDGGGAQASLCVPATWFKGKTPPVYGHDAWLMYRESEVGPARGDMVALSLGFLEPVPGTVPTMIAHADPNKKLGTPECAACDMIPLEEDFTIYFASLDAPGKCRERSGNLLMDALEALQWASYQGPHAVLVEPVLSNVVLWNYDPDEARRPRNKTMNPMEHWNPSKACTIKSNTMTPLGRLYDWPLLGRGLQQAHGIKGFVSWDRFTNTSGRTLDLVLMLQDIPTDKGQSNKPCIDDDTVTTLQFFDENFEVKQFVCIRSSDPQLGHFGHFFPDQEVVKIALREAVSKARRRGQTSLAVGLYFYMVQGSERARLHPSRYMQWSAHNNAASIWQHLQYAPHILQMAVATAKRHGLLGERYLAAHWRKGDWWRHPDPRMASQALRSSPDKYSRILRRFCRIQGLRHVFLMTNANRQEVTELQGFLPDLHIVQVNSFRGDENHLLQLVLEMAIAATADYFVAFGEGIVQGLCSMPSLLVMQMRLHRAAWPLDTLAYAFTNAQVEGPLGL